METVFIRDVCYVQPLDMFKNSNDRAYWHLNDAFIYIVYNYIYMYNLIPAVMCNLIG